MTERDKMREGCYGCRAYDRAVCATNCDDAQRSRSMSADHFCGCCGREIASSSELWCAECSSHVLKTGDLWNRTWFAQFKELCPWQVEP